MSRATDIARALTGAFPGLRVTSTDRSRAEQDALIARGATKASNSQHLNGTGLDVVLPKGTTPQQVRSWLSGQGIEPGEFLNETGRGTGQGTGAHLHIGLAPKPGQAKGGDPASSGGGTSFDRAKATRDRDTGPSMQAVYDAYRNVGKPGGMTPQEAAQYEHAVNSGQIMLPRGGKINSKPPVAVLPASVVKAYNSHQMDDDPEARAQIERELAAGRVSLPRGMSLQKPAPRTAMERIGMGVRDVMNGAGGLVDVVAGPANVITNAVTGANLDTHPFQNAANSAADAMGLAKPESDTENLYSAVNQGGTQGLLTAGAGMAAGGVNGATGAIGRAVSASPMLDTVSGAAGGGAQEYARQSGAGTAGQIAAGLIGGAAPVGLAATAERAAMRARPTLADTVAETPRAAVVDEAGNLTPHGQEVAARHSATPEEVVQAYEAPPRVQAGTANEQLPEPVAREATTGEPVAAPAAEPAPRQVEQPAPSAAPEPASAVSAAPEPATPTARVSGANEFGIDMTRGQATKQFDVQDAEQRLRNSNGSEGEAMRQFAAKQVEQVKAAAQEFRKAFGDTSLSAEERGTIVQEAVRDLRDNGQRGVSELYKQARELGQPVPLQTEGVRSAYDRVMVEANVPDAAKAELTQEMARYGLIGKEAQTNEANITTVTLDDGQKVKFYGPQEDLRLDNAESLRKVVSDLYQADGKRKLTQTIKSAIDDATEEAATKLAAYEQDGAGLPAALERARAAHVTQKQTFEAGDIVQQIADWKKGKEGVTGTLKPEQVVAKALSSPTDLKRLKAVLLAGKTPKSLAAWKAIQAHGLAELFQKATTRNTNAAGEITEAISGAKLRSAIEDFGQRGQGTAMLKTLLEPEQFNTLMKLRRVIEDVTIPISGTVNHSNSGNLIMRLVRDVDNQVTAAFAAAGTAVAGPAGGAVGGTVGRMISPVVKQAKEARQAAETLEGATAYTAEKAAQEGTQAKPGAAARAGQAVKQAGAKTVSAFIETYGSPRILAPVLVATNGSQQQ